MRYATLQKFPQSKRMRKLFRNSKHAANRMDRIRNKHGRPSGHKKGYRFI